MAEFLVRTVDKVNINSREKNSKCLKRGDVVVIQDDGWPWSTKERNNPEWIIKEFPGTRKQAFSGYLAMEPGDPVTDKYLQRRFSLFDLVQPLPPLPTEAEVLSAQRVKPPWSDRDP